MRTGTLKFLSSLKKKDLHGKRVLVRVDFNEPVVGKQFKDGFRLRATAPTIQYLLDSGACVIMVAHLEDNEKKVPIPFKKVLSSVEKNLGCKVTLVTEYTQVALDTVFKKGSKTPVLLENVRFHDGEKKNDQAFAKLLASFADIYVDDAFSAAHREHASIVGVPKYIPAYAGLLFAKELSVLSRALKPEHPFLLIIGGAKFATKFALLKRFVSKADAIFLGGVLANTFLKAHEVDIGDSLYEQDAIDDIQKHFLKSKKIILPFDARVSPGTIGRSVFEIEEGEKIGDIGPETIAVLAELARDTKYVLWNGPLGHIEEGFIDATRDLLKALAKLKKTKVILGGGDTLEVVDELRMQDSFYHVSTGGGAMLDFLADGTLPGIEALKRSR